MDRKQLNLCEVISPKILTREKQEQTWLPIPSFVTTLYKQVGVPRNKKTNMELTLLVSTNIQRIKSEFLRDEEHRARRKLIDDKIIVVDVEALKSATAKLGLDVGIMSSSSSLHLSYTPIPNGEAETEPQVKDDHSPLTRAAIYVIG